MGRSESVKAHLGLKILLGDLVSQMNETNMDLILTMFYEGIIEDEGEYYNASFTRIVHEAPDRMDEIKPYFIKQFSTLGSRASWTDNDLQYGSLSEQNLLVCLKPLLNFDRWGYSREGVNSLSRNVDFDLSVNLGKYKDIQNITQVFILTLMTG